MVILLYAVAGLLLILTVAADSPFTKTYLVVFATASFLFARFVRIEGRLDRIEGICAPVGSDAPRRGLGQIDKVSSISASSSSRPELSGGSGGQ
jgi:hypothetical protein